MATIHGYAFRFNEVAIPQGKPANGRLTVAPGGFILPGDPCGLSYSGRDLGTDYQIKLVLDPQHGSGEIIGWTGDGSLRFEQNANGLYFEWTPGPGAAAQTTLRAVSEWRLNGACIGFPAYRESHFETIQGKGVEVITRTYIGGLTLAPLGCCPGTGCKVMAGPRLPGDADLWGTRRSLADALAN